MQCLEALYKADLPEEYSIEVFLVDDGSTDGTGEAVERKYPKVNVILGSGNLFWNRGMHLAWKTASQKDKFDYFLWLNDDVEIVPNAIKDLVSVAGEKKSPICGTMQSHLKDGPTYGGRDVNGKLIVPTNRAQVCHVFNGNLVLIPFSVFKAIGNLDPIFLHAIGDYDFALRAIKAGFKNYVAPNYSGYCEQNSSLPKWCLPQVNLKQRFYSLYSPLGNSQPLPYFKYIKRHEGILRACRSFVLIHARMFFPQLWK